MATTSKKKRFLLTFMGFPSNGGNLIIEVLSNCEKMTTSIIDKAKNSAIQAGKKRGLNMDTMSLINSLELDEDPESQEGGTE